MVKENCLFWFYLIVNENHCNNPSTESTFDPPYGEIQEIYENKAKADKVKELKTKQ